MAYNTTYIELGEGVLLLKKIEPTAAEGSYIDVGGTLGAEFSYKPEFKDILIGQAFSAVKSIMTGEEGLFKVTLMESSMRNLIIGLGLDPTTVGSSASADVISFGGKTAQVIYAGKYTVAQVDNSAKNYNFYMHRMRVDSGLVLPFEKENERKYEVTFKLMADSTNNNTLGRIERDR